MRQHHNITISATATRTIPLFRALQDTFLREAYYTQELDADGDKTVKIRDLTAGVDLTAALDVDALAAAGTSAFTLASTNARIPKGNIIGIVYTVSTAGSVAPGEVNIALNLDDPHGTGTIPGSG